MFDPVDLIRSHIFDMPSYKPILPFEVLSQNLGLPEESITKLDANENPYGPLPQVYDALAQLKHAHIYPDPESRMLRSALANYHGVPEDNFVVGAGADELIDLTMRLLLNPGDKIINCPPTFGMYNFDADISDGLCIDVPRNDDFSLDYEHLMGIIKTESPKLMFLANPNNPDGSLISREHIDGLLALPIILVIDEAYIEFAAAGSSMIQNVPEASNLIVLRTFSKWAGLAGLRVGYGVFPQQFVPHLMKIKQPYNVSVAAAIAARVSLQCAGDLMHVRKKITAERARLFEELGNIPWIKPYPSQANFILCKLVGRNAYRLKQDLQDKGILLRYFQKPGLENCIRISVGTPAQTDRLIEYLNNVE